MLGLVLAVCTATPLVGDVKKQPDETLPGFKERQVYDTNGIDSVNLFSGDVHVAVPLGPEYPLSSGRTWRLAAHYSSKIWHMFQYQNGLDGAPDCPGVVSYDKRAQLSGYSTLGVGWTLELGFIRPGAGGGNTVYKSPDGAHHTFANLDADSGLRLDSLPDGTYVVREADGTVLRFAHRYQIPTPVNGFDFSDEDRPGAPANDLLRRTIRFGLSSIADRFGNTVLEVTYKANCSPMNCSADAWKVDHVELKNPMRTVWFNWGTYVSPSGTFDVVNSVSFPVLGGQPLLASFAFKQDGTLSRSGFDSDYNHGQSPYIAPGPATTNVPFLTSITQATQTYSFDYDPVATNASNGLLTKLTLPTGGSIVYGYSGYTVFFPQRCGTGGTCVPERDPGAACAAGNETNVPVVPTTADRCTDLAYKQPYLDLSPAVISRTEQDPLGGAPDSGTTYERRQFGSGDGAGLPLSPDRIVRRVIVKRPDGNGNTIATKHVFAAALDGFNGPELSRRYYQDCNTGGTPVRSVVQCFPSVPSLNYPADRVCGVMETSTQIVRLIDVSSLRPIQSVTWYGENPLVSIANTCSAGTSPACWQDVFSDFDTTASEYRTVTRSANTDFLIYPLGATRTTTTNWMPISDPQGTFLPKLYTWKTVTDAPCLNAPCTTTTHYDFNLSNGFLNSTWDTDAAYGTLTRSFSRDASTGDPVAEWRAANFGDQRTFTDTRTFQSGLATSVKRTAPAGIDWKSFDVERDSWTGLITTSRDPKLRATTYEYDSLSRLKTVTPPAGDLATTYCYFDWSTTGEISAVFSKRGGTACLPDDGVPGVDSGPFEAYQYDGLGRLRRQMRRLPNRLTSSAGTLGFFAFREIRYNSAGLAEFESEWSPCGVSQGLSNVRSCFQQSAPTGTTYSNFDFLGRARTIQLADGNTVSKSFNDPYPAPAGIPNSDTAELTTVGNVGGVSVMSGTRKDMFGRTVVSVEDMAEVPLRVSYFDYNTFDKLVNARLETTDAAGTSSQNRSYTYNGLGLLLSERTPEKGTEGSGSGLTTYDSYDALGNVLSKTVTGTPYAFSYDALGRLKTAASNGTPYLQNTYDQFSGSSAHFNYGQLTTRVSDNPGLPSVTETFDYTIETGRPLSKTTSFSAGLLPTVTEKWYYNTLGLLATENHPRPSGLFSVSTTYRSGLPVSVKANGLPVVEDATYGPAGNLATYRTGNQSGHSVTTTISIDTNTWMPRPKSISTIGASSNFTTGDYVYDGAGNVRTIGLDTFQYDSRSRLRGATYAGIDTRSFTYDDFGNLTGNGVSAFTNSVATNQVIGYLYDSRGNLTRPGPVGSETYTWDAFDRMASYQKGTSTWRYAYTGDNERIVKSPTAGLPWAQYTLRDSANRVATEFLASGSRADWSRDNVYLGNLLVGSYHSCAGPVNPGWEYTVSDHLGTPRLASDPNGNTLWLKKYWPFGEEAASSGSGTSQPLAFALMEKDPKLSTTDIERFYDHARTHSSTMGRFLSPDMLGGKVGDPQSFNRYAYARNNPVRYVDPDGREAGSVTNSGEWGMHPGGPLPWKQEAWLWAGVGAVGATAVSGGLLIDSLGFFGASAAIASAAPALLSRASDELGRARELAVAELSGGRVVNDLKLMTQVGSRMEGVKVDVIGGAGELIAVGGAAKANQLGALGDNLKRLANAATARGVTAQAYFEEGTPKVALDLAKKWLGEENVKIFRVAPSN